MGGAAAVDVAAIVDVTVAPPNSSVMSARRFHQLGALAYQRMAAARQRRVDGARDGEDFTAVLRRQAGGDERPAVARRLHDQDAARQPGDQAIATGKVAAQGRAAQRQFRDQRALRRDAFGQSGMPRRIDLVDSRAHDGDRAGAVRGRRPGAFVGRRIDALRQPADDAPAVLGQEARESAGVFHAAGRRAARCPRPPAPDRPGAPGRRARRAAAAGPPWSAAPAGSADPPA